MPAKKAPAPLLANATRRGDSTPITSSIDIGGVRCRVACVDDVLPHHQLSRGNARPRLVYIENEVVHFELDGHRYALVADEQGHAKPSAGDDDHEEASQDMRRLLTSRELQIVQLVSMGYLSKQIADRLHISEFTVRSYLKTIYCKLGVRSRGAMVYRYAQATTVAAPNRADRDTRGVSSDT